MNINLSNIGIGTGTFGMGNQSNVEGKKVDGQNSAIAGQELQISEVNTLDVIQGSEPISEVPEAGLFRDDTLGKLVSSAFNLPPPPMPEFNN